MCCLHLIFNIWPPLPVGGVRHTGTWRSDASPRSCIACCYLGSVFPAVFLKLFGLPSLKQAGISLCCLNSLSPIEFSQKDLHLTATKQNCERLKDWFGCCRDQDWKSSLGSTGPVKTDLVPKHDTLSNSCAGVISPLLLKSHTKLERTGQAATIHVLVIPRNFTVTVLQDTLWGSVWACPGCPLGHAIGQTLLSDKEVLLHNEEERLCVKTGLPYCPVIATIS